jgi:serpin B
MRICREVEMIVLAQTLIIMIVVTISFCPVAAEPKQDSVKFSEAEANLVESSNKFGLRLFQEIAGSDKNAGNVFISPLSVSYALAMTLNGAENETYGAIASTLELNNISTEDINASFKNLTSILTELDSSVTLDIANSIWYRSGLKINPDFVDINKANFDALVSPLDFGASSAANTINSWVSENTRGKIEKIVSPPIDPSTIMFLINAIYFKGSWATQFESVMTRDHPFYPEEGKETKCRMMFNTANFDYFENDLFQAISLPYGEMGFGMMAFLPRESLTLDDLVNRLDEQNWAIWQKGFYETEVKLGLPRFKFEYEITLNDMLKAMGMEIAFDGGKADFGKMVDSGTLLDRNIFIDQVKHKTFLQVDEEGTEAAAVTSVTMALTSAMPAPTPVMIIERPFLFAIWEKKSESMVFIGKVIDPVWEE